MNFDLEKFMSDASGSEIMIALISIIATIALGYALFKIFKYLMMVLIIISGLYYFGIIDKGTIEKINNDYKIGENISKYMDNYSTELNDI
jgi:hypothetical protein